MIADETLGGDVAVFSDDRRYRYHLLRNLASGTGRTVAFCMLNPSTADAFKNDPTVRRCVGYARAWGFYRLVVVNLFALRATDPAVMLADPDPVGPDCDIYLRLAADQAEFVVCAWGNHGARRGRADEVLEMLKGRRLMHLKMTQGAEGEPMKDPLEEPKKLVDARARYFAEKERAEALSRQATEARNAMREAFKAWDELAKAQAQLADDERFAATGDRPERPLR